MALVYPPRLTLAQLPTPLQLLERFSAELGGPRIWLKRDDLTGCAASGNKVRKLEFILAYALEQGYDGVISCGGLQSNHCRATAVLAAQLGLSCSLLLRGEQPADVDGNLLLARLSGAELHYVPVADYQVGRDALLLDLQQRLAGQGRRALIIPTGGSDGLGIWGYIRCAEELKQDFARHQLTPAAIVHATGSGGTQAGLCLGAQLHELEVPVIGINVCDDAAYFQHKIRQDIHDWQQRYGYRLDTLPAIDLIDGYVGAGYAKACQRVMATIARLARLEGVILDPVYTGKAFDGLCQEIAAGRFADASDIVFIHTGGIFGLYAYREQLSAVL